MDEPEDKETTSRVEALQILEYSEVLHGSLEVQTFLSNSK